MVVEVVVVAVEEDDDVSPSFACVSGGTLVCTRSQRVVIWFVFFKLFSSELLKKEGVKYLDFLILFSQTVYSLSRRQRRHHSLLFWSHLRLLSTHPFPNYYTMDPFDESNINSLNVVHHCLSFLDANHTKNKSCLVSKSWNNHCTHETIWQIYTIRDFNHRTKQVPISELRAHRAHIPTSYSTLYTGGINYDTPTKLIVTVSTFREVWSCWKRLNKRTGLTNNLHYLKFATAWEKVLSWNENNMPHLLRTDAACSKATNLCLGEYVDASLWSKYSSDIDLTSIHSDVKAFFACNNGQNWDNLNNKYDMHTSGQIGGFNVYNEYQCSVLVNVQKAINMASALKLNERDPDLQLLPVTGMFGMYQGTKLYRFACVDLKTGFMYYVCIHICMYLL